MNHKKILIALAVVMLAAVSVGIIAGSESSASVNVSDNSIWGSGFTNTSDGTLSVKLTSNESEDQTVTITVTESGNELAKQTVTVPAGQPYTAELRFRLSSVGEHNLTVKCESENSIFLTSPGVSSKVYSTTVTVDVTQSILSKPSTYAAIAVVAILIVIAFYLHIRNAPSTKPDTTFTELERQKRDSRGEEDDTPKTPATERKRYVESGGQAKGATKPSPPPEEKKAASFTELEKQKKEKKEAPEPKKKETSSEEPKKLKYVSSRRK